MLLPDKFIAPAESLVGAGLHLWQTMPSAMTIGEAWFLFRNRIDEKASFFHFVLVLDVLFMLSLIDSDENILIRRDSNADPAIGE
ncbi:ABC-three component system middle component 6 [Arthrobacter alpinus]|uniref:ABC-three component system middle component 6 n=1 Tax=Arthrobacter alpinus TaxID=656366 RepID=UPI0016456625|nr:ABC-three component system middle component 6 [Arthrobacter alpinus]